MLVPDIKDEIKAKVATVTDFVRSQTESGAKYKKKNYKRYARLIYTNPPVCAFFPYYCEVRE